METSDMYDMLISYVRKYKYDDGDSLRLYLTNLPQTVVAGHFTSSACEKPEAPFLLQTDLAFNISSTHALSDTQFVTYINDMFGTEVIKNILWFGSIFVSVLASVGL